MRLKQQPHKVAPDPGELSLEHLIADCTLPMSIHALNHLPDNPKQRIYRTLIPPALLMRFGVDPISWKGPDGCECVKLIAKPGTGVASLSVKHAADAPDPFFVLDVEDNSLNGIDLNFIALNDPLSPRFRTDVDAEGRSTYYATARRNLAEEERAMQAGLAPVQVRSSLHASRAVFQQVETFMALLAHQAISLEPLSYASAWVFERRGFAYVRGHKLMSDIHHAFQPGGRLHRTLDDSTPFRRAEQWRTVRGRAWAIHDGILEVLDARWDGLRMIKQVGREAGVETFPNAEY